VFSIVNGVVLRPLAYREAQRLVSIREVVPRITMRYATSPVNARHFEEWRRQATAFASIAEIEWRTTNLTGTGDPAQVVVVRASGTVFDVLQMPVALGRPLTRDDERPDHPPVAVISQRLWEDRLGRDPQVVGRGLILGGTQYTVVGVLEPRSELPAFDLLSESASLSSKFDLVVPFRLNFAHIGWMGQFNYAAVARLKTGVTLEQARAELDVIQQSVADIATFMAATVDPVRQFQLWSQVTDAARRGRLQRWWDIKNWISWGGALAYARGYLWDGRHTTDYVRNGLTATLARQVVDRAWTE
jgi:hypothetical protein